MIIIKIQERLNVAIVKQENEWCGINKNWKCTEMDLQKEWKWQEIITVKKS